MSELQRIKDITNIMYINLDSRPDRKLHIEAQLSSVGLTKYQRFKAIKTTSGAIGCTLSHLKCLTDARDQQLSHLLVCEDDTTFLNPVLFRAQLNAFFGWSFTAFTWSSSSAIFKAVSLFSIIVQK